MITLLTKEEYTTSISGTSLVTTLGSSSALVTTVSVPGPQGAKGDAGEATVTQSHEAATNLSGHRAIRVAAGLAYVCDGSNASHVGRAIGISTGAATAGDDVSVQTAGILTESSWSWTDGPVYVGASGVLTQSFAGLAYVHQIGMAVSATQIDINPLSPILIS